MTRQIHRHSRTVPAFRHRQDRPERHTIAELVDLDPGHHPITRLTGVLATLDRIGRVAVVRDW